MASAEDKAAAGSINRETLAWAILIGSTVGIVAISAIILWKTDTDGQIIFTGLLALFGTWVGTILAFYFSRENFEAANASLQRVVRTLTPDERLKQLAIRTEMIARSRMIQIKDGGRADKDIMLSEVCGLLVERSRIPVLDAGGLIRYVIHSNTVYRYITDESLKGVQVNPAAISLETFLAHKFKDETVKAIVTKIAFAAVGGSLADARAKMIAVAGAQDVIVTATGGPQEPVEGWITDMDLARYAQM